MRVTAQLYGQFLVSSQVNYTDTTADHLRQLVLHSSDVNQQFVRILANRVGEHEESLLGLTIPYANA